MKTKYKDLIDQTFEWPQEEFQMENDELRVILKQYLNGISVTPDMIETDNPLVVINTL